MCMCTSAPSRRVPLSLLFYAVLALALAACWARSGSSCAACGLRSSPCNPPPTPPPRASPSSLHRPRTRDDVLPAPVLVCSSGGPAAPQAAAASRAFQLSRVLRLLLERERESWDLTRTPGG
ncbi:hypothetical protein AcW1_002974 [Taiwanofungus camphoratus]|nr:hypothetical protein AcW1_002974 [Antrodia cinnamomea]